ncbi:RES family NAD+ phosphorylase [Arthrobacter zhangbolii]|uniref:RES family NAD+ phosphorylase n=1 Tax=Arthrobacter zhangbolii TaxID=2886936 RepID=A0A9X1M931_9MICC|nr:RES family NAD+ phosphorylase [Arthrobacter zhangbolii]MCC3273501.1 RES family NAD+ phosphorylase [Arthrobacter zhangbolii]UON92314.1 RES family NAD+ phosphorylase [Arthrobacter zhangbolii]
MTRENAALKKPDDVTDFPVHKQGVSDDLFRAVAKGNGSWYFASKPTGRFNLSSPRGTCYMATDIPTAIRERLGETITRERLVPQATVDAMEVTTLRLPAEAKLADTGAEAAANFGAIRELGSISNAYALTCQWATAFDSAGLDGVLYESRFTSIARPTAIAYFGAEGPKPTWDDSGDRYTGEEAFILADMEAFIAPIPTSSAMRMAPTPKLASTPKWISS